MEKAYEKLVWFICFVKLLHKYMAYIFVFETKKFKTDNMFYKFITSHVRNYNVRIRSKTLH